MPLEPELLALMRDTVTIEPAGGLNEYAERSYGAPTEANCYISHMAVRTIGREGSELTSEVQVILADPSLVVSVDDRLTLPNGSQPAIIEVLSAEDDEGPYYLEVRA